MTDSTRVPDPPKIVPPAPNLAGDEVKWVRRDAAGNPVNWGHMHRGDFNKLVAAGDKIELQAADFQPPPSPEPDMVLQARFAIGNALNQTDRYFTADALDNVSAAEQAQWRAYRKALRAAYRLDSGPAIVAAVPADPKGVNLGASIRPPKGKL